MNSKGRMDEVIGEFETKILDSKRRIAENIYTSLTEDEKFLTIGNELLENVH